MDADQFLAALPDLTPILGKDEGTKQDVALRCWRVRGRIRDLPRYARRAAANHRIDRARQRRRKPAPLSIDILHMLADPRPTPPAQVMLNEAVRDILGAIHDELTPPQREAVEALAIRGESLAEASARLGRTPGALRSDCWRGQQTLKRLLTNGDRK